jgi:hypothetical protein
MVCPIMRKHAMAEAWASQWKPWSWRYLKKVVGEKSRFYSLIPLHGVLSAKTNLVATELSTSIDWPETGFREMSVSGVGTIEADLLEADFWPAVRLVSVHNFRVARDPGAIPGKQLDPLQRGHYVWPFYRAKWIAKVRFEV